jgi:phosphatidate cytidylyltransferase
MALPDLSRRVATALLGAAAFLAAIWGHPLSLAFAFALISGFSAYEFAQLTRVWHRRPAWYVALPAFLLGFAAPLSLGTPEGAGLRYATLAIPLLMLGTLLLRPAAGNHKAAQYALAAALWVGLPLALLALLGAHGTGPHDAPSFHRPGLVTGVLVIIWSNDVGAYFAGSTLGRTKLAPSISPNKSWEGVIGGLLLGLVIAWAYARLFGFAEGAWLGLAPLVTLFGTSGDLLESRLKRLLGVKDSGTLLPGHGGFLDRFDSLYLVAPMAWVWFRWFFPLV